MRLIDADAAVEYLMTNMNWMDEDGRTIDDADEKRPIIKDLIDGVPIANIWIDVKEKLPEPGQKVLVYSKFGHISDMTLERNKGMNGYDVLIFDPYGMKPGTDIKYWMPIPELPTEDKR